MMRVKYLFVRVAIFILISSSFIVMIDEVRGDGGFISRRPQIRVFESGQNAIIAFNGGVERLILSVNIGAENETEGFHIIPFPSMPRISLGNISVFNNLSTFYHNYNMNRPIFRTGSDAYMDSDGEEGGSISIVLTQKLGDHQITVIKVNDPFGFKEQLKEIADYLAISIEGWPEGLVDVIKDYTLRGIRYFTIDKYPVFSDIRTTDPLVFDFNTEEVFFPLKISSLFSGEGYIGINIFTPSDLPLETEYRTKNWGFDEFNFLFSKEEVASIDQSLAEIVPGDALLTRLQTRVDLGSLSGDLEIGIEDHVISAMIKGPYHWERRSMATYEDRMMVHENGYCMNMYSLPDLTLLWSRQIGGYPLQTKPFFVNTDSGVVPIVLVGSGYSIRVFRLDSKNGNDTWWTDFNGKGGDLDLDRDLDLEVIDHPLGQYLAVMGTDLHLFDMNTGAAIPIPPHKQLLGYTVVRHGQRELIAYKGIDGTSGIYSPFNVSYFDPSISAIRRYISGELPNLRLDTLFWVIKQHEIVTGKSMDLDSILALDHFIRGCNMTRESSERSPYATFFDLDMGMLELRSVSGKDWTVRCLNRSTRTVDWETKVVGINSENYHLHAFSDMDLDGSNELILVDTPKDIYSNDNDDEPPAKSSIVIIDSSGRILFERSGFDASLPIQNSNGTHYVGGMTREGFYCYDILSGLTQYTYNSIRPVNLGERVLVSEWNENCANVSFIAYDFDECNYYRTNSRTRAFEEVARIDGRYQNLIDLGSTVGIVFDRDSRLYTFQYDDSKVRADYPSIWVPEDRMGIDGLRSFLNGSEMEVDSPLITPFPDLAPIMIIIILIALIMGRARDRVSSKRTCSF